MDVQVTIEFTASSAGFAGAIEGGRYRKGGAAPLRGQRSVAKREVYEG